MIPSRPAPPAPPSKESISERIARLRREQTAGERPRFSSAPPLPTSSAQRWLAASSSATELAPRQRYSDPRRGTAGPAPPRSWTAARSEDPAVAVDGRNRHGAWLRPRELIERKKLAQPLEATPREREGPPSLFEVAGGVLVADVARAEDSLLLEHVAYLPNHLRVRLLAVFSDWRNPAPLTDEAARELLRTDVSDGDEVDGVDAGLARAKLEDDAERDDAVDDGGWEDALGAHDADMVDILHTLDLSFSHVSLRTLRTLLLRPVASSSSPSTSSLPSTPSAPLPAPKLVPVFPHLHTLNLTSTPRIPFSDAFFDLLPHLISLRSLSLAGKSLDHAQTTATSASLLPRLAAATPTLRALDLSFVELPHVAIKGVDWDARWLDLRVLGLRSEWVDWQGEEVGPEKRERIRTEVREMIMLGRQKKRRWIEIVV
ncbi:hypothetical protein JCM10450v2_003950 [Rhodotorula kratochvilovae]